MKKYIQLILTIVLFAGLTSGLLASDRSIIKIGSDVHIEKDMRVEDAVAVGGSVYVDGIVDGDAVAVGGTVVPMNVPFEKAEREKTYPISGSAYLTVADNMHTVISGKVVLTPPNRPTFMRRLCPYCNNEIDVAYEKCPFCGKQV